ncbi:MAG TPA: lipid-A-disaccharide synthase [Bacillota bacterium]|nr:lipid-A-disaccharide synthase [Bacillota bacterium]
MKPVIFVSTCEFSGDMHGEVLIRELKQLLPDAEFYGIGGERMAAAGVELMLDPTKASTIGFVEVLKNLRKMKRLIKEVTKAWEKRRPDLMLWLDSAGLNLILAKEAKERGIPVVCMFSPSAWAYGQDRAVKLAQRVKLLLAIWPFEADFYRKFGANAVRVGNPLIDRVKNDLTPEEYRRSLKIEPNRKLIALLPGSRRQEVARLLPVMLEAAVGLTEEYPLQLVLPVAASIDRAWLESILAQYPVACTVTPGGVYNLLAAADAAVVASGTATLEAALLQAPMVIVYRISKLSLFIYRQLQTPEQKQKPVMIGQPNLIMDRKIVPELTMDDMNAANIIKHLKEYLDNPKRLTQVKQDLAEVKERCGPPGVMPRAAAMIAELLKNN